MRVAERTLAGVSAPARRAAVDAASASLPFACSNADGATASSVDGCVSTSNEVGAGAVDQQSLQELALAATDVSRALNDLLNHVKDGQSDRIPYIMEQIMSASGEIIAGHESAEMVRQAKTLAQSTAELIQAIKGEAECQSDIDLQVK